MQALELDIPANKPEPEGLTFGLLAAGDAPEVGVENLKRTVLNPLLNNAVLEPYNTAARLFNSVSGDVVPEASTLPVAKNQFGTTGWFVQTAAGGIGMIVPYTIAGKAAGGVLRHMGATLGVEGATASFLKSHTTAGIAGAAAYDGLRTPHEGETRVGNMLGGAAAFTVFGLGNQLTREMPLAGRVIGRALTGFAGADAQLVTSRYVAGGELPGGQELVEAGVAGAFMNNVLPHAQQYVDRSITDFRLNSGRSVWLDQYVQNRLGTPVTGELNTLYSRSPWAKIKFGEHNDTRSTREGTINLDPRRSGHEEIARGLSRLEQVKSGSGESDFKNAALLLKQNKSQQAFESFERAREAQEAEAHHKGHVVSNEVTGKDILNPQALKMEIGAWPAPGQQSYEMRFRQEFNQFVESGGKWRPGFEVNSQPLKPEAIPKPGPNASASELKAYEQQVVATELAALLQKEGHIAVFAGGAVRDGVMGIKPKDFDIATSATPTEVGIILRKAGYEANLTGKQFGVIKTRIKGEHNPEGQEYDIATLRNDGNYTDGRRPDSVKFVASLYEDAARRDLTFNAMFKDPLSGKLFDFFGGGKDLENKVIRTVGEPSQRFSEDYLRMMRVPRLLAQKFPEFTVDPAAKQAISEHAGKLSSVASERLAGELRLMLTGKKPVQGLDLMMETGIMRQILPEVAELTGPKAMQDPRWHPEGLTWTHTRMVVDGLSGNRFETVFGGLLHDIGKPATQVIHPDGGISNHGHAEVGANMARAIANRLKLSSNETRDIVGIVAEHMNMHQVQVMRPSTLKKLFELPYSEDLIKLQHADATGTGKPDRHLHSNLDFLRGKQQEFATADASQKVGAKPVIHGKFLMDHGIKPGKRLGEIKDSAMEAQRNGEFQTLEEGLAWLRMNVSEFKSENH